LVDKSYFVQSYSKAINKYKQEEINQMLNLLGRNIFVLFGERVFQQTIGIPMDTNCAPPLANLFLYAYCPQMLLKNKNRKLSKDL
jgi:hypothetical protein